jgi:hypothetical protein
MKLNLLSSTGLAAVLALLVLAAVDEPAAAEADWTVVAASGQVEMTLAVENVLFWRPVSRGMALPPAGEIRTGADGRVTLVSRTNIIVLDPDSHIEIPEPSAPGQPARVFQDSGTVTYSVKKAHKQRLQVVTPYLVAGVKGTLFRVSVGEETTSVLVSEGTVTVTSLDGRDFRDVQAGESAHLDRRPGSELRLESFQPKEFALRRRDFNAEQTQARRVSVIQDGQLEEGAASAWQRSLDDTSDPANRNQSGEIDEFQDDETVVDLYDEMTEELDKELRPVDSRGKPGADPAQTDPANQPQQ